LRVWGALVLATLIAATAGALESTGVLLGHDARLAKGVAVLLTFGLCMYGVHIAVRPLIALRDAIAAWPDRSVDPRAIAGLRGPRELGDLAWTYARMASAVEREMQQQQLAQERLRASEQRTRAILESALDGIATLDAQGRVLELNQRAQRILGIAADAAIGRRLGALVRARDAESARALEAALSAAPRTVSEPIPASAASRSLSVEYNAQRLDGSTLSLEISLVAIDEPGLELRIAVLRDVSERLRNQTQSLQAHKLESIGQLAAGIAHEINTPTQYIGDNARFLSRAFEDLQPLLRAYRELEEGARRGSVEPAQLQRLTELRAKADADFLIGEIPHAISQSLEGIERVAGLVRSMKEFSHPGRNEQSVVDLNRAIESTLVVARNEWKYVAEMRTQLDADLPAVRCLPGELNQVVLNLVVNAAQAIGAVVDAGRKTKGCIEVRTLRDGEHALIEIRDDGDGIPLEIQGRIFDPFFTTKPVGQGSGQGLPIARHVVVDKHGGSLDFESQPGRGTCFRVRIPIAGLPQQEARAA
jgi:PAS domain S-box-containing protein